MIKTTKAQRQAILAKFKQSPTCNSFNHDAGDYWKAERNDYKSYKAMRKAAKGTYGPDGAITVYWCNMWLCIEQDGYTHS